MQPKPDSRHIATITQKWREMAIAVNNQFLLSNLIIIFRRENNFKGYFDEDSQIKSIPVRLLTLMSLMELTLVGTMSAKLLFHVLSLLCTTVGKRKQ